MKNYHNFIFVKNSHENHKNYQNIVKNQTDYFNPRTPLKNLLDNLFKEHPFFNTGQFRRSFG